MPSALSIADAVDRRGCDLTGCPTCPHRVYQGPTQACMLPGGVTSLLALPALERLLGRDPDMVRELLDDALEVAIDRSGHEYRVARVSQVGELAQRAAAVLEGLGDVLEGPFDAIRPAWVARATACLGPWLEDWPDPDGVRRPKLLGAHANLRVARAFLDVAVERGAEVEFDRWDVPFDP